MSLTAIKKNSSLLNSSRELFLEAKDISCFRNIHVWASELERDLHQKVLSKEGLEQVNLDFEIFCNQFSLLLFLNGQNKKAISVCSRLVSFYCKISEHENDFSYLEKGIQPIINWSRVYRILGQSYDALKIFSPINVFERDEIQILKHNLSIESLRTNIKDVLTYNSIVEPLKIFLRTSDFDRVLFYLDFLGLREAAFATLFQFRCEHSLKKFGI